MLTRITGLLESVTEDAIPVATVMASHDIALEVLIPAYLANTITPHIDAPVTFYTRLYLEAHGQGTSFVPRAIGFGSPAERSFFEVFTSVKGVGTRKALRALVEPPSTIAAYIVGKNAKALTQLPEIGKRTAELMIAELSGKIDRFAGEAILDATNPRHHPPSSHIEHRDMPRAAIEAIAALMALGEQRSTAEQKVQIALTKAPADADVDVLVQTVFGR